MVSREAPGEDTVLAKFLICLAADFDANPERLNAMDPVQQLRLQSQTNGIEADLSQSLQELAGTYVECVRKTV